MFGMAFAISGVALVVYFVISFIRDAIAGEGFASTTTAGIIIFLVSLFSTWAWLYRETPTMNYKTWWEIIMIQLVLYLCGEVLKTVVQGDSFWPEGYGGAIGIIVLIVAWGIIGIKGAAFNPWGQETADRLAHKVTITKLEPGVYPETDTEHMGLVPREAAAYKADTALNEAKGKNSNISTLFNVGTADKQSINHHLYWVFRLNLGGTNAARSVSYTVPGYIVVDAEDPNAKAQLKLGYKMKYTPGARGINSLTRLIWKDHRSYSIDDVTLEINDDWQPYFTASLNRPAYSFGPSIPEGGMIVVDPQTGKITRYKLGKAPQWVDRVYSAQVAERMMNWWGEWGAGAKKAPWKAGVFRIDEEGSGNRYRVSGDPVLVYTKDKGGSHPEWQMLLTSWKSDNAVSFVVLFDARKAHARLYRVPNLQTDNAVKAAFESTSANTKKYQATDPALHKIYGRLTWVVGYINENDGNDAENQSLQALGLVAADNTSGNNVQFASSKTTVLDAYQSWLASSQANKSPGEESKTRTSTGTVEHFSSAVVSGNTYFYLILKEQPNKVFRGKMDDDTTELAFVTVGDRVRVTYNDTNQDQIFIVAFDDEALKVGAGN